MEYGPQTDCFDDYKTIKNTLSKTEIIKHIESLSPGLCSLWTHEMFTGEDLQAGILTDGDFRFPMDFLHYYKKYDIGIPYEYEEYLNRKLVYG